jgi:hypothetical protein
MNQAQRDLFQVNGPVETSERATPIFVGNPEKVRSELLQMLAEAKAATTLPWDARRLRLYKTIFPQMSRWLPRDEAESLCQQFRAELLRLETI